MTEERNPLVWMLWLAATTLMIASTRNPLYLATSGLTTVVVYLSTRRPSATDSAWSTVLRIGIIVALLTIAFNLLTVHAGERVITHIPGYLPIVGGSVTLNAAAYGVTSAAAILILMVAAAAFSHAVDRAALLRSVPRSISSASIAAIVGLSFFPQMLAALRDVREAQAARGFRVRSFRDLPPLVVPVLHLGLERAFSLAETIESRGFGSATAIDRPARGLLLTGLLCAGTGVALFGLGSTATGAGLLLTGLCGIALGVRRSGGTHRGSYREIVWSLADVATSGICITAMIAIIATFSSRPEQLVWSPYPTLNWPPFGLVPGLAMLLLIAPALFQARKT